MVTGTTATRRGPYKRRRKLTINDTHWAAGDIYQDGARRWIITQIRPDGAVELVSSNTVNHGIAWNTTLDHLTVKARP